MHSLKLFAKQQFAHPLQRQLAESFATVEAEQKQLTAQLVAMTTRAAKAEDEASALRKIAAKLTLDACEKGCRSSSSSIMEEEAAGRENVCPVAQSKRAQTVDSLGLRGASKTGQISKMPPPTGFWQVSQWSRSGGGFLGKRKITGRMQGLQIRPRLELRVPSPALCVL